MKASFSCVFFKFEKEMCLFYVKLLRLLLCLCVSLVHGNIPMHVNTKLASVHLIEVIYNGVFHRCANKCVYITDCLSVSFNRDDNRCDMFRMNSTSVIADDIITEQNTVLLDIGHWPKFRTGACWNKPCGESTTCEPKGEYYRCTERFPNVWTYLNERSEYFVPEQKNNLFRAQEFCSSLEAHLVNIGSEEENIFLRSIAKAVPGTYGKVFWTALIYEDQNWKWYDTKAIPSFTDWGRLQPDNPQRQPCVVFARYNGIYNWHDNYCSRYYNFICERP